MTPDVLLRVMRGKVLGCKFWDWDKHNSNSSISYGYSKNNGNISDSSLLVNTYFWDEFDGTALSDWVPCLPKSRLEVKVNRAEFVDKMAYFPSESSDLCSREFGRRLIDLLRIEGFLIKHE